MKIHLFKALVVFFAVFGCGNTGKVRAESFGIKFLGSSTNDTVSGSAGAVPIYQTQSQPTFQNPLFGGDFPDVGILRVGGDFYVTQTSFAYGPGPGDLAFDRPSQLDADIERFYKCAGIKRNLGA